MSDTKSDVSTTIRAMILAEFMPGEDASALADDGHLKDDGILDSMGTAKLVQLVEERFGVSVEAHEIESFTSVEAIAALVRKKTKG